ncbi:MAG: pilus assembly protein PilM [Sedimentisphaerales bacterium]|nr:pilus assembly protein PilM [Sedimentisphaerales bacterium]
MLGFFRQKEGPIGIDLGSSSIKMMQLNANDGTLRLTAAAYADVPVELRNEPRKLHEWQVRTIKQLLAEKPFKGRRASTCLPNRDVVVQHLRLAKMSPEQLNHSVGQLALERLPFDAENALLRHIVAGEIYQAANPMTEVILLAAANDAVEQHLDLIERLRIDIDSVNVELCAMLSSFAFVLHDKQHANDATMFVDLGHTTTKVVIAHGPHVAFSRPINIAGKDAFPPNGDKSNTKNILEQLCNELKRCVHYHDIAFANRSVSRIVLIGGMARNHKLGLYVAKQLGLPAHVGDPVLRINETTRIGPHSDLESELFYSDWTIAFGLALSGMWTARNKFNKTRMTA